MREVFGSANEIATVVWEKGKKGDSKLVSVTHEYIVAFARNKALLKEHKVRWRRKKPAWMPYWISTNSCARSMAITMLLSVKR